MERGYKIYDIYELNPGDHLCVLYETDEEHKALITPYLRSGLENNEKVFYIVDARTSEAVLNYLRDDGVDVDPYLESGQLSILTVSESYMKGGVFDPDGMIKMLTEETEKALQEGYSALRVTGEMSWALRGLPGSERLIEYETKLNEFFPIAKALAICQYDCRVFDPEILLDILTTHPIAVIGTEIYENFYYIPTEDFLAGKAPEKTLEHWTENLKLRRKMENTLRESEERYSITLDAVNEGIWDWDVSSGDAFFSPNYYKLLGYNLGEFPANYTTWRLLVHPDDRDSVEKELQENTASGRGFEIDLRMKTKSEQWLWVSIRGKVVEKDSIGKATRVVGTLSDISERIIAEEKIHESLEEKEMLLKEIHHRVKNNLMIISSLLNLQSRYIKDKTSKDIFKQSQNRARSMALIHERLYQSTDLKRIDFGDYIRTLSNELFRTYAGDFGLIELKISVEDIFLDINTAIPLGLIVNELITNSLKHAFPEGMNGEINVDFHPKDDHYEFTVNDNGIGFPNDLDFQKTDSLGLQIINSLTDQIDGEIKLNRNHGTEFKITFKELEV
jgi:PAS domain S-box-containing protein